MEVPYSTCEVAGRFVDHVMVAELAVTSCADTFVTAREAEGDPGWPALAGVARLPPPHPKVAADSNTARQKKRVRMIDESGWLHSNWKVRPLLDTVGQTSLCPSGQGRECPLRCRPAPRIADPQEKKSALPACEKFLLSGKFRVPRAASDSAAEKAPGGSHPLRELFAE